MHPIFKRLCFIFIFGQTQKKENKIIVAENEKENSGRLKIKLANENERRFFYNSAGAISIIFAYAQK